MDSNIKIESLIDLAKQYISVNNVLKTQWLLDQIKLLSVNNNNADRLPNIIFCNLVCSGSSGIDPILKEVLTQLDYYITPFGPEGTSRLKSEVIEKYSHFYHWTHDPITTFWDDIDNYKLIYLHRDLRDVAISWAYDFQKLHTDAPFRELLLMVISHNLPPLADAACTWVASGKALVITFDEFKANCLNVICKILVYLNINFRPAIPELYPYIVNVVDKHSYENVTGRKRGEEGSIIRNQYMLRKGVSGDWKNHFDDEIKNVFKRYLGKHLIELGYESGDNW